MCVFVGVKGSMGEQDVVKETVDLLASSKQKQGTTGHTHRVMDSQTIVCLIMCFYFFYLFIVTQAALSVFS